MTDHATAASRRDYLGLMLDQTAVEVDLPGLLIHHDPGLWQEYEFSLGGDAGSLWLSGDAKTA